MANDEIELKIQRLYESIGEVVETDISQFRPKISNGAKGIVIYQDWSCNFSEAKQMNYLYSLVGNIASLQYYLNKWADHNGRDKSIVKNTFENSEALKIIHDLWDTEKHANSNNRSKSGLYPVLKETNTYVKLTSKAEKGSSVGLTFNADGTPKMLGNGSAEVVISGNIVDKEGKSIGDFHQIAMEAVADWESVLRHFNIPKQQI